MFVSKNYCRADELSSFFSDFFYRRETAGGKTAQRTQREFTEGLQVLRKWNKEYIIINN
jgi:hypothetical protein